MEPLLFALLIHGGLAALTGLISLFGVRQDAQETSRASRVVARTAGLTDVEVSRYQPLHLSTRLRGRSGPITVDIHTSLYAGEEGQRSIITLGGLAPLSLGTEGVGTSLSRQLGGLEIHVGDLPFDDALFVRGDERLVRAVLDAETRRLTLQLFEGRVEVLDRDTTRALESQVAVDAGVLRVEAVNIISSPKWLGETLLGLLDVARRLAAPADIPGRLAANGRGDPLSDVRLANLRTLAADYPGLPATQGALRSALADPDPEVALWAATAIGEEGLPTLREIASSPRAPEKTQAKALWALGARLPTDEGRRTLSHALRARRLPVAEACLAALGESGGAEVVDSLAKVLAVERGVLAAAAARALGGSGESSAERPLLGALSRSDGKVGVAAAEALGEVGSAAAVSRLRTVEETSPDEALRRSAREAVARIQERLTGASPGQLSLADGDAGQLSLSEDETGRVSLPLLDGAESGGRGSDRG